MNSLDRRLAALTPDVLRNLRRGIEKESLRVRPDGTLADTPHPAGLGSALTHPHITTDFSESQLELITGVHASVDACLAELTEIHQVVYRQLGDELLWCTSMPCKLPDEDEIPLGHYGRSNIGRLKTVYRQGLSHRYGRRMQTISGIHYNFSLPEAAWPMLREQRPGAQRRGSLSGPPATFRADPQLPPPFVAAAAAARAPRRRCAAASSRDAPSACRLGHRHLPRAVRHVAAHGPAGLPERCAGIAGGELQQPRQLRENRCTGR